MLSGFVLSFSYREKILGSALGFGKYALLRLARLMPLHLATASPFIAQMILMGKIDIAVIVLNLLLLQSWVPHSAVYFSLNAPSWSLSNEIFFYICFFFLVFLSSRQLLALLVTMIAAIAGLGVALELAMPGRILSGANSIQHWLFYIFPLFRLVEFLIGMLLYNLWSRGFRLPRGLVLPSYLLLGLCMYVSKDVPEALRMSLFFLPSITLFLFCHLTDGSRITTILSHPSFVLLRNASFAFYLIHQPVIMLAEPRLAAMALPPLLVPVLLLAIAASLSVFIYLLFERRAEAMLKQLINTRLGVARDKPAAPSSGGA